MKTQYISILEFCRYRNVEEQFIDLMLENELIQVVHLDTQKCIAISDIPRLEKYATFYYELEVNAQGIAVADLLLKKIELLQEQMKSLEINLKQAQHKPLLII